MEAASNLHVQINPQPCLPFQLSHICSKAESVQQQVPHDSAKAQLGKNCLAAALCGPQTGLVLNGRPGLDACGRAGRG